MNVYLLFLYAYKNGDFQQQEQKLTLYILIILFPYVIVLLLYSDNKHTKKTTPYKYIILKKLESPSKKKSFTP
jgi:hypothetical protein